MRTQDFIFNEKQIKKNLIAYDSPQRLKFEDENFIRGAVLVLIQIHDGKPYNLVLIKRTTRKKDKHSGEMSFPGGKFDPQLDSTFRDTAIRETEEELGIPRKKLTLLGAIDDHITPKMFIITPFVGYINDSQVMVEEVNEVEEIVKIPIIFFADKKNYRERTYKLRGNNIAVGKYVYQTFNNTKYVIFGATSHIIVTYLKNVYDINLMQPGYRRLECDDFKERIKKRS